MELAEKIGQPQYVHEIIGMSSLSQFMQLMHAWVDQSSVKKQKMPSMGNRTAYKFGNVKVCDLSDVQWSPVINLCLFLPKVEQ